MGWLDVFEDPIPTFAIMGMETTNYIPI